LLAFGVLLSAGILFVDGSQFGHELFCSARHHQWPAHGTQGRLTAFVAAPLLVLRPSGGVHRDLAGHGHVLAVLSVFSRKPIFGYKAMVYAILAIGFLGFMVWGHHMS